MGSGRVLVVKGKQRYGDKREGCVEAGRKRADEMLLEIIKLSSNNGGNILCCVGCP